MNMTREEVRFGEETWYTVREASWRLCLSEKHLRKLCASGKVRAVKLWDGGQWRIPESSLLERMFR